MSTVQVLTIKQAQQRRAKVIKSLGCSEHDLRERAAMYLLDADELAALTALDELDYLLRPA